MALRRAGPGVLLPRLLGPWVPLSALLSGFFGIGGGFLIVPGLILAADMELPEAASASLVAVTAFGVASASSYAWSGLIDWPVGHPAGRRRTESARSPAPRPTPCSGSRKGPLTRVFAWFVIAAGLFVGGRGALTEMQG